MFKQKSEEVKCLWWFWVFFLSFPLSLSLSCWLVVVCHNWNGCDGHVNDTISYTSDTICFSFYSFLHFHFNSSGPLLNQHACSYNNKKHIFNAFFVIFAHHLSHSFHQAPLPPSASPNRPLALFHCHSIPNAWHLYLPFVQILKMIVKQMENIWNSVHCCVFEWIIGITVAIKSNRFRSVQATAKRNYTELVRECCLYSPASFREHCTWISYSPWDLYADNYIFCNIFAANMRRANRVGV